MLSLANEMKNGAQNAGSKRLNRLAEVLSFDADAVDGAPEETNGKASGALPEVPLVMPGPQGLNDNDKVVALEPVAVELPPQPPQEAAAPPQATQAAGTPVVQPGPEPGFAGIQQAARQVANALVDSISEAVADVRQQVQLDRPKLESIAAQLESTAQGLCNAEARIDRLVATQQESASSLLSTIEKLSATTADSLRGTDSRMRDLTDRQEQATAGLDVAVGQMASLEQRLGEVLLRLERIDDSLRNQGETLAALRSVADGLDLSQRSLRTRLDASELSLRTFSSEARQRAARWDKFMGSLKNLDVREEPRYQAQETVEVVVLGEPDSRVTGRIVDVSDKGLGLMLDEPVPVGGELRIETDGTPLTGKVRYCRRQADGHAVGLRLNQSLKR